MRTLINCLSVGFPGFFRGGTGRNWGGGVTVRLGLRPGARGLEPLRALEGPREVSSCCSSYFRC